ncbi:hypothetical protein BJ684DRAFT_20980 [Piptocephalis cylindrospora]|uniref:F-box domain-containing protein n=1 Tax=Piptocephalis cylindrospora TaxID=1907219 RepID=A0A4P9Y1R7_9FUNG|nr:hypothetical protein BJ684DRAFT_20980 [Piptocephalis cylindrospora]|eukprot:RKP12482.1 hypothetical protein BJ684DRAFT_20980 [Piptocephalis cylindrospora]
MKSLRRSAIALPDFIKAMKRIDPETHRHSYQGQIHSLITLFKKNDFTDAKAYAAAKKLKHEMYYDISNPEALLGLIPEAYHMLRINMFLHNFIQGRKTLKEAKTSKVHHPPIRDGQDRLAALNAPILSTSDDLRELQNVEKLQKALEAVESPPKHFRILNDKRQYETMPKLCLEELPPEVIGVLASFLPTNDLWALAKTSQSMLGATRSALGLRSLRPCHPMSTQDIERWNGLMTRRPIGLLRLPSSSIGVDLSDLFFLGLLGDIPPLRLPRGLRRLNIVYKSKKQHMDIFALHTIDLLMSTLSAQHARSLLRLHISLEGIDLAKLCLPSFSLLKSFSLSMCPKRSVLSEIIPLPDLTGLPSQTLTSLTLHQLDHTPLSQVLHLLPRFPFLKYLALRYYQRRGTADILEQLVHGKCTRLSTLDLMELSRPSSGAPPLAHRGFNDVDRPPPSEGYAERLSAAFLSLSALGVRLKDLRLEDIWSDQVPIYMLVNRLWASSLRVLHLTTAQDVPLFGLAQQYAHWPFLEEMTIQDVATEVHN